MVERQLLVLDLTGLVGRDPFGIALGIGDRRHVRFRGEVRNHDHLLHSRQARGDFLHALDRVVRLAVVAVAVGAEQQLRLGLAEAVEHAVGAEIRRARRPDGPDGDRREREHAGLGHVRDKGRDAVAGFQACGAHRLRATRNLRVQLRIRHPAAKSGLVPEHQRVVAVPPAQQVLGEIEARIGKPFRAGHLVPVDQDAFALSSANLGPVPQMRSRTLRSPRRSSDKTRGRC